MRIKYEFSEAYSEKKRENFKINKDKEDKIMKTEQKDSKEKSDMKI